MMLFYSNGVRCPTKIVNHGIICQLFIHGICITVLQCFDIVDNEVLRTLGVFKF